jgi:hypothetical protein
MFFLIDNKYKIIFGWSAKCGCSHIKRIFWFLQNGDINAQIHTMADYSYLPNDIDIENYTCIIISRNPYKRIISGFLDKYRTNGEYRNLWKHNTITFAMFIDELSKNDWNMIDRHHFTSQTAEAFDNKILMSKCIKCFDIENIDYKYIEELYNVKIPLILLEKKEGHERKNFNVNLNNYVYNLDMKEYYNYNIDIKYFYNEELKNKVFKFYENDFKTFYNLGIDYKNYNILNHFTLKLLLKNKH